MSPSEQTPRTPRTSAPATSSPKPSVTQIEANVAHELNNQLSVVSACGERLATSPDVTAAARLEPLAGRGAHAIIDGRRRGVSLRRWIDVNPTLRHLEAAVRLLLSPAIDVALELDPNAGAVCLATGELDLMILNLVLDVRSRLKGSGRLAICSARQVGPDGEIVTITVADQPREGSPARSAAEVTKFGLATVGVITRDAGGKVAFLPGPGGGWEVLIRLPARPSHTT